MDTKKIIWELNIAVAISFLVVILFVISVTPVNAITAEGAVYTVDEFASSAQGSSGIGSDIVASTASQSGSFSAGESLDFTGSIGFATFSVNSNTTPIFTNVSVLPKIVNLSQPVTMSAYVAYATSVIANITRPDTSVVVLNFTDVQTQSYVNTNLAGRYSITFIAEGDNVSLFNDYFDVVGSFSPPPVIGSSGGGRRYVAAPIDLETNYDCDKQILTFITTDNGRPLNDVKITLKLETTTLYGTITEQMNSIQVPPQKFIINAYKGGYASVTRTYTPTCKQMPSTPTAPVLPVVNQSNITNPDIDQTVDPTPQEPDYVDVTNSTGNDVEQNATTDNSNIAPTQESPSMISSVLNILFNKWVLVGLATLLLVVLVLSKYIFKPGTADPNKNNNARKLTPVAPVVQPKTAPVNSSIQSSPQERVMQSDVIVGDASGADISSESLFSGSSMETVKSTIDPLNLERISLTSAEKEAALNIGAPVQVASVSAPVPEIIPEIATSKVICAKSGEEFVVCSGEKIASVVDLAILLGNMDQGTFTYHVSAEKNDFATWIYHALNMPELASQIGLVKDKAVMRDILLSYRS